MLSQHDRQFMRRALALAAQADGRTHPNPMVGAVIVRRGRVVGEGYHQRAGTPHAEVHALRAAGARARGATLYVTLEPCCHHGRTPPCTDAIIAAGIARVVYGMRDPNPQVAGSGLAGLRAANIVIAGPLLAAESRALNRSYCHWRATGTPYVILKVGCTLDGKIADHTGRSQWITNAAARLHAQQWRARVDAILVGRRTLLLDDPRLTVRLPRYRGPQPVPIVWLGRGAIPWTARLLRAAARPAWVIVSRASAATAQRLMARGHGVIEAGSVQEGLRQLGALGISALLLEGGGATIGAFLRAGAVQYASVAIAPMVLGRRALTWSGDFSTTLQHPLHIHVERIVPCGDNVMVEGCMQAAND